METGEGGRHLLVPRARKVVRVLVLDGAEPIVPAGGNVDYCFLSQSIG